MAPDQTYRRKALSSGLLGSAQRTRSAASAATPLRAVLRARGQRPRPAGPTPASGAVRSVSVCRKTWPSTEKNSLRVMRTRREFRINLVFRLCILQSLENGEKAVFKPAVPSIAEGRFSWPRFGLHRQRPTASFRGFCGYLPAISIRCDPFEKVRRADRQKRGKVSGYSRLHCCRISSPASFSGNKRCGRCC